MPSKHKSNIANSDQEASAPTEQPRADSPATEQDSGTRVGRKKSKNAATKRPESTDKAFEAEIARDPSTFNKSHSTLGHAPSSFPPLQPTVNEDVLEELNAAEKVSGEHTPPQDNFVPSSSYGRSPPSELIPGLSYAPSSPARYSSIGKGGFNARSPPISPPQAKARPVSYGGRPSSNYGYPRLSTSPYGQTMQPYGSPPALPHLPQQHFYNAQDINLRGGARPQSARAEPPSLLKFAKFPGRHSSNSEAVFVGHASHLDILSYVSDKLTHIGSLAQLPGIVHDAIFLTWSSGSDPLRELRPLVALALHDAASIELGAEEDSVSEQSPAGPTFMLSAVVYSLRTQEPVAELVRAPMSELEYPSSGLSDAHARDRLSLTASGDHLLVSSATSGEVFVFGIKQEESGSSFECLAKLWTSRQPRMQRRDSSHGRSGPAAMSPADLERVEPEVLRPIVSLDGRWLAYCPATTSQSSVGASLGDSVAVSNPITIASSSAPTRPSVNCEVDSPDADTLFGKVARGAAQSIARGSKWLGEMGMQAWRNWNTESLANPPPPPPAFTHRSLVSPQLVPSQFPPTHGDPIDPSSEPELVSIVDLKALKRGDGKKSPESPSVLATFHPPAGCSFVSFAPNGLSLLTASRKGDVQYIWDLFQIRHSRTTIVPRETPTGNFPARVRQLAKYERFSPSLIVDVQWESPIGNRFATLTQNCTVHMFDLPSSALRWPPPRKFKKPRTVSAPTEKPDTAQQPTSPLGFLASARNLATKTQPMLASWRGRTPSVSGGVSGIGSSGVGLASATGLKGGKVVAAGFSKSLGAATDTVAHIRHAGQSKLYLKVDAAAGRLVWRGLESRTILCVLDATGVKNYYVRKTNPRERQLETVSVFDARKAVAHKLPNSLGQSLEHPSIQDAAAPENNKESKRGFWRPDPIQSAASGATAAPLSYAEFETNAPYQPFHSDHRVTMSVYSGPSHMEDSQLPTVSTIFQSQTQQAMSTAPYRWIFGEDIPTTKLSITPPPQRSRQAPQESVVYRETTVAHAEGGGDDDTEQIISTTRRRKTKTRPDDPDDTQDAVEQEDDFFEDDLEVLDFAADRV